MTDFMLLEGKLRGWLRRVPLSVIVLLLEAVHDELRSRNRTATSGGVVPLPVQV
jgi:hypothetical protein